MKTNKNSQISPNILAILFVIYAVSSGLILSLFEHKNTHSKL